MGSLGNAKSLVASDTTIINIPEISVIGTTGSSPMTNVPVAPRVMMLESPSDHTAISEPGGGGGMEFCMTATATTARL